MWVEVEYGRRKYQQYLAGHVFLTLPGLDGKVHKRGQERKKKKKDCRKEE